MRADIAIITIREDEFKAVFDRLKKYSPKPLRGSISQRTYAIIPVPVGDNKTCVVAMTRSPEQGNDVSQKVASHMIQDLDPQILLVVGIGGGFPKNDFTLGDVVISSRIHNFNVNAIDKGKITFNIQGGIDPFVSNITASLVIYESSFADWNNPASIGMVRPSIDLSQIESNLYGDNEWKKTTRTSLNSQFGPYARRPQAPLFTTGAIASSNSLIKDTRIPTQWLDVARSTLAVEMESAGVLQAAQNIGKQYPVMAIRGISDIVGFNRDDLWRSYACQSAGAFTYAFIKAGIIEPRENSAPVASTKPKPSEAPDQQLTDDSTTPSETDDSTGPVPLNLFISYSEKDEKFKEELETHLVMLRREGTIRPWYSQQREAGTSKTGNNRINQSQIILLLISPNFLASDYLYDQELKLAMKRHATGKARVVPIIIRSANMGKTPFSDLQELPRSHQPVDKASNRDEAWSQIAREIREVCNSLRDIEKKS